MQSPSDATTFLFTDIEGSTRLWDQEPERMSRALAGHDALLRKAVEGNHGVVVKMIGDGTVAAFADPLDALGAALALQQSLADPAATNGMPLHVRCGLHLGIVERRDNDFFGGPVNRTARIMAAAHGGQVLLSQAVADRVREHLPPSVSLRDLGGVRLRDLAAPEHLYQLLHPQLRQDFPALRSLEATPNNLPQQLTSFIGRERELAEAKALLDTVRLLTLLGMGGLGKTRLSLQMAADVLDANPDGVWFLDLAPIRDASLIPKEAAKVLGVNEEPGKPLTQTLCAHLRQRKLLIIFDNCEHLVGACAALANALLRAAPDIRIVATSREALRVPGEQTYPVLPLALPDRKAIVDILSRSDAVQLFMERAQLQKPGFALTERDAPAVAELVARLEGIPLALELAAARMRSLSVQDINARLNDRYKLLTGGGRVLLERQQTLRALVSWSYDLLQEREQVVFDRLCVFAGGFDLTAAEVICGADPLMPEDILDLVTSLVDKSLVMAEQGDDGSRFRLLETIREYAHECLVKREDLPATATRHCHHYLGVAKTARGKMEGAEQAEWMRRLEVELDNLRSAIALSLAGGVDAAIAVKFAVALMRFWILRGYSTEGRGIVRAALALPSLQAADIARAHALNVGGVLAINQSSYAEATSMLTECLALRRGLGNPRETAAALSTLSVVHLHEGDAAKARDCEEESLGIFRELGDRIGEGIGLLHLGEIYVRMSDDDEARKHFEQCLAIARTLEHEELESECERNLGELDMESGNLPSARERFMRALRLCQSVGDRRGEASAVSSLGRTDAASGDNDRAQKRMAEALRAFRAFEMNSETLGCLEDYAGLLEAVGRSEHAVRAYAAAAALRVALFVPRSPRSEARWRKNVEAARVALGVPAFDAAWSAGQTWALDEAIDRTLATTAPQAITA